MWRVSALDRDGHEVGHFELESGELTIGRDADRQLILPSASVSRRHARILVLGQKLQISDDASANGVMVDGARITSPTSISVGSQISISDFVISISPVGSEAIKSGSITELAPSMRLVAEGGPYDGRVFEVPSVMSLILQGLSFDNTPTPRGWFSSKFVGGGPSFATW